MKNEKTNGAEPEMGYCPFEHWLGTGRAGTGALGAQALGRWALGRWARWAAWRARHGRHAKGRAGGGMRHWARQRAGSAGARHSAGRSQGCGTGQLRCAAWARRLGQQAVYLVHSACLTKF